MCLSSGFQRPVHVYMKSPSSDHFSCQPQTHPPSCKPHPLYEQPRLKSVVVVCPNSHTTSKPHPLFVHDKPDPPPLFPPGSQPRLLSCQDNQQSRSSTLAQSSGSADKHPPCVTMATVPPTCGSHLPPETTTDQQLCSHGNSGTPN